MEKTDKKIFRGVIIPAEWDNNGEIVKVAIATYDENCFPIESDATGKDIKSFLRKRIIAEGVVTERQGHRVITVHKFQIDGSNR